MEHSKTEQGFLLWAIFDVLVDGYFDVTDVVDDRLDEIEERVFPEPPDSSSAPTCRRRSSRCAVTSRRCGAPPRRCARSSTRSSDARSSSSTTRPSCTSTTSTTSVLRVGDLVEAQRDLLTGLLEANLAVISNQLNQVMKKMTSWGAILIVATLIAGIYGMNFRHMPELHWQYGYALALGLMGVMTFVLWRYFKREELAVASASSSVGSSSTISCGLRRLPITRLNRHPTSSSTMATPATIAASTSTSVGGSCTA